MEQRQKDLLAEIIRCYVKSALPIGSRFLEEKCGLGVSSATLLPWENRIRELAKKMAAISQNAVVVGFSPDSFYYTGLSNLFSQPEFKDPAVVYDLGLVIDHLDQVMAKMFGRINEISVKIGSQNPFGEQTSVILTPWHSQDGLMGILGPMRMDYEKNLGLLKFVEDNI